LEKLQERVNKYTDFDVKVMEDKDYFKQFDK